MHIRVKTFVPGNRTCSVGMKAEKDFGNKFFWVLCGLPKPESKDNFEYYIIPAMEMAKNTLEGHQNWLNTPGKNGQKHKDNTVRTVPIPPFTSNTGWNISEYLNRWDLIEQKLND